MKIRRILCWLLSLALLTGSIYTADTLVRQDGISAAAAVAAPFLISLPLTALLCVWQKAPLHLDGGMLTVYAALAALLLFTYWHPVHRSLKRVLRPL